MLWPGANLGDLVPSNVFPTPFPVWPEITPSPPLLAQAVVLAAGGIRKDDPAD
jgi:hypothetical protein